MARTRHVNATHMHHIVPLAALQLHPQPMATTVTTRGKDRYVDATCMCHIVPLAAAHTMPLAAARTTSPCTFVLAYSLPICFLFVFFLLIPLFSVKSPCHWGTMAMWPRGCDDDGCSYSTTWHIRQPLQLQDHMV